MIDPETLDDLKAIRKVVKYGLEDGGLTREEAIADLETVLKLVEAIIAKAEAN